MPRSSRNRPSAEGPPGNDTFDLARFVEAQEEVIDAVRAELGAGRKQSHWMWFVFPQLRGLGASATSRHFGISGLAEARAFLAHPVLGPRLLECTRLMLAARPHSAEEILGHPDHLKLYSSMTLFRAAAPHEAVFSDVLEQFYRGEPDDATLRLLRDSSG